MPLPVSERQSQVLVTRGCEGSAHPAAAAVAREREGGEGVEWIFGAVEDAAAAAGLMLGALAEGSAGGRGEGEREGRRDEGYATLEQLLCEWVVLLCAFNECVDGC